MRSDIALDKFKEIRGDNTQIKIGGCVDSKPA